MWSVLCLAVVLPAVLAGCDVFLAPTTTLNEDVVELIGEATAQPNTTTTPLTLTVCLEAGTYTGLPLLLTHATSAQLAALYLVGVGNTRSDTVLSCGEGGGVSAAVAVRASVVVGLANVTLTGCGGGGSGQGSVSVAHPNAHLVIRNSVFTDCSVDSGAVLYANAGVVEVFESALVANTVTDTSSAVIVCVNSSACLFVRSSVWNNDGDGVQVTTDSVLSLNATYVAANIGTGVKCSAVANINTHSIVCGNSVRDTQCSGGSCSDALCDRDRRTSCASACEIEQVCVAGCEGFTDCPGDCAVCTRSNSCPDGYFSVFSHACRPCEPGSAGTGGVCEVCDAGHVAASYGMSECLACQKGSYAPTAGGTECTSCPRGSTSTTRGSVECVTQSGWVYGKGGVLEQCATPGACCVGGTPAQPACGPCDGTSKKVYTGKRCTDCAEGFYHAHSAVECVACPALVGLGRVVSFGVLVAAVVGLVCASRYELYYFPTLYVALGLAQQLALLSTFDLQWPHFLQRLFSMLAYSYFGFSVAAPCAGGVATSYVAQWVSRLLIPLYALVVVGCVFGVVRVLAQQRADIDVRAWTRACLSATVLLATLLHPLLTLLFIELFDCTPNQLGDVALRVAPDVVCSELGVLRGVGGVVVLAYVVGVPVAVRLVLARYKSDLYTDPSVSASLRLLLQPYAFNRHHSGLYTLARKSILVAARLGNVFPLPLQLLIVSILLLTSLVYHVFSRPLYNRRLNRLEGLALTVVTVFSVLGWISVLLAAVDPTKTVYRGAGGVITTAVVLLAVFAAATCWVLFIDRQYSLAVSRVATSGFLARGVDFMPHFFDSRLRIRARGGFVATDNCGRGVVVVYSQGERVALDASVDEVESGGGPAEVAAAESFRKKCKGKTAHAIVQHDRCTGKFYIDTIHKVPGKYVFTLSGGVADVTTHYCWDKLYVPDGRTVELPPWAPQRELLRYEYTFSRKGVAPALQQPVGLLTANFLNAVVLEPLGVLLMLNTRVTFRILLYGAVERVYIVIRDGDEDERIYFTRDSSEAAAEAVDFASLTGVQVLDTESGNIATGAGTCLAAHPNTRGVVYSADVAVTESGAYYVCVEYDYAIAGQRSARSNSHPTRAGIWARGGARSRLHSEDSASNSSSVGTKPTSAFPPTTPKPTSGHPESGSSSDGDESGEGVAIKPITGVRVGGGKPTSGLRASGGGVGFADSDQDGTEGDDEFTGEIHRRVLSLQTPMDKVAKRVVVRLLAYRAVKRRHVKERHVEEVAGVEGDPNILHVVTQLDAQDGGKRRHNKNKKRINTAGLSNLIANWKPNTWDSMADEFSQVLINRPFASITPSQDSVKTPPRLTRRDTWFSNDSGAGVGSANFDDLETVLDGQTPQKGGASKSSLLASPPARVSRRHSSSSIGGSPRTLYSPTGGSSPLAIDARRKSAAAVYLSSPTSAHSSLPPSLSSALPTPPPPPFQGNNNESPNNNSSNSPAPPAFTLSPNNTLANKRTSPLSVSMHVRSPDVSSSSSSLGPESPTTTAARLERSRPPSPSSSSSYESASGSEQTGMLTSDSGGGGRGKSKVVVSVNGPSSERLGEVAKLVSDTSTRSPEQETESLLAAAAAGLQESVHIHTHPPPHTQPQPPHTATLPTSNNNSSSGGGGGGVGEGENVGTVLRVSGMGGRVGFSGGKNTFSELPVPLPSTQPPQQTTTTTATTTTTTTMSVPAHSASGVSVGDAYSSGYSPPPGPPSQGRVSSHSSSSSLSGGFGGGGNESGGGGDDGGGGVDLTRPMLPVTHASNSSSVSE